MAKKEKIKLPNKPKEFFDKVTFPEITTDVGIYIISYKRINCQTPKKLLLAGVENFTIILGNDDEFYDEYVKLYGKDRVVVFNKDEYMDKVKYLGNMKKYKPDGKIAASGAAPARNFIRDLSVSRGEKTHIQLDDDYICLEFCSFNIHSNGLRGKFFMYHALNTAKRFLEKTGLPYVAGSLPNSPISPDFRRGNFTTPSIVKKGFNFFVFDNEKFAKWRYKTADDVMLTFTNWQLGIPVYGIKPLARMGLVPEGANKINKGDSGNVAIYNSDLSWFKAISATLPWPINCKAGLRYIQGPEEARFCHKLEVVGKVPYVISGKYGIKGKKNDPDRYVNQYRLWRYKDLSDGSTDNI